MLENLDYTGILWLIPPTHTLHPVPLPSSLTSPQSCHSIQLNTTGLCRIDSRLNINTTSRSTQPLNQDSPISSLQHGPTISQMRCTAKARSDTSMPNCTTGACNWNLLTTLR